MYKVILILLVIAFGACNQTNEAELTEDELRMLETIAFGTKPFARAFASKESFEFYKDTIFRSSIEEHVKESLGLIGISAVFGAETTGYPYKKIALLKDIKTGNYQAINFFDEYCFYCGGKNCNTEEYIEIMKDCQSEIKLDESMNYIAREFNFERDSLQLLELGTFIIADLFSLDLLCLADQLYYENLIPFACECCAETKDSILAHVFSNIKMDKARYFKGEQTFGLWELSSDQINDQEWILNLQYVNERCVYRVRY